MPQLHKNVLESSTCQEGSALAQCFRITTTSSNAPMAAKWSKTDAGLAINNCKVETSVSTAMVSDLFFHSSNSLWIFSTVFWTCTVCAREIYHSHKEYWTQLLFKYQFTVIKTINSRVHYEYSRSQWNTRAQAPPARETSREGALARNHWAWRGIHKSPLQLYDTYITRHLNTWLAV